ncbi:YqhG family protein [Tuberibacillus sp. Marseille-P3662]|uniref:YqhG family protein n=1 Tax=Tuberibacillus sp. Marseille-P3662 TaxID=1965358 RepID=UPI000A1CC193|nr:YqhG family protein [Tuberibacillus sp. Marseille-P3662]
MNQEAIHDYLVDYFTANACDILDDRPGYLRVKLTVDLDKQLMNRPFYWHYLEKMGGHPETAILSLKTEPSDDEGEMVHFGSPRLHQIFKSTQELSPHIRLYENVSVNGKTNVPLEPWLAVNSKISYQSDLKKDAILSIGLNLINGTIVNPFHDQIQTMALTPKIPNYCFTLQPMIKPSSGLRRIESYIERLISQDDHEWAEQARRRWEYDEQLLDQFYEDLQDKPDIYTKEKQALKEMYEPRIHVSVINGGLFYLTSGVFL